MKKEENREFTEEEKLAISYRIMQWKLDHPRATKQEVNNFYMEEFDIREVIENYRNDKDLCDKFMKMKTEYTNKKNKKLHLKDAKVKKISKKSKKVKKLIEKM